MKREDMISVLTEDEKNGQGEIIEITDEYVSYYDCVDDSTKEFRFEEACTDEYVKSLIRLGEGVKKHGLTEQFIVDVLKKAFGDDYYDAVCTMTGIIIPSNEEEFRQMLKDVIRTGDDVDEWYEWCENEHCVGKMLHQHQIVLINEEEIRNMAKELAYDKWSEKREYDIGIIVTIVHEMRHLMLDTNPFLSEEEFPEEMRTEESVEAFARERYEALGDLKFWR